MSTFMNKQYDAINVFNTLRLRAITDSWIASLFKKENSPKQFEENRSINLRNKRFMGIQDIRLDKIIGTLGRETDFDKSFRPLKKHLRDRWVSAFLRLAADRWQPITVHKVGEFYYVEDGHHRVSVALSTGMIFIEAEVWDHSSYRAPHKIYIPKGKPAKRCTETCSTNI